MNSSDEKYLKLEIENKKLQEELDFYCSISKNFLDIKVIKKQLQKILSKIIEKHDNIEGIVSAFVDRKNKNLLVFTNNSKFNEFQEDTKISVTDNSLFTSTFDNNDDILKLSSKGLTPFETIGIKSFFMLPCIIEDKFIGSVFILPGNDKIDFDKQDKDFLNEYASKISYLLNIAKTLKDSKKNQTKYDEIYKEIEYYIDVSQAINSSLDLYTILEMVVERVLQLYDFDGYSVSLIDKKRNKLKTYFFKIPKHHEEFIDKIINKEYDLSDSNLGGIGYVLQTKKAYYVEDAQKLDLDKDINKKVVESLNIRTQVMMPIVFEGLVIGILLLSTYNDHILKLDERDLLSIERLTKQLATAVKNALLYDELKNERVKIETAFEDINQLYSMSKIVNSSLDLDKVMELIIKEFFKLKHFVNMAIYLANDEKTHFELYKIYGETKDSYFDIAKGTLVPIDESLGLLPKSFIQDRVIYLNDTDNPGEILGDLDKKVIKFLDINSLFYIPLKATDDKIGVLVITGHGQDRVVFSDRDIDFIKRACVQISMAIRNSYLYNNLEKQKNIIERIYNSSPVAILTFDKIGTILNVNATMQKLLHFNEDELIDKNVNSFSFFNTEDFKDVFENALLGQNVFKEEISLEISEKKLHYVVDVSMVPLKIGNDLDSVIFTIIDNTEKAIAQMELVEDLKMAKRLQEKIITSKTSTSTYFDIFTYYQPFSKVGGDFYEISEIKEDYLRVFLADATGHGVQAALTTMLIKNEYDKFKLLSLSPSTILSNLNDIFCSEYQHLFVFYSAVIIDIDIKKQTLFVASAGHPAQIMIRNNNVERFSSHIGTLIGLDEKSTYKLLEFDITSGDKVLLYTDGISEDFNFKNPDDAEQILFDIINKHKSKNIKSLGSSIIDDVLKSANNKVFQDDVTLLGIEIK